MKIMASGPITSWEIDRETVVTVSDFIFLGSKITADGDCGHDEWIRKLWYIYTMEYYSAIKLKDTYSLEGKI